MATTLTKLQPGDKVAVDDPRLFDIGELAIALGVPRSSLTRLMKCGFRLRLGRASVGMVHKVLEENPDLSESE